MEAADMTTAALVKLQAAASVLPNNHVVFADMFVYIK